MRTWSRAGVLAMAFVFPAFAKPVDHHTKMQVDELITAYTTQFNQHDVAGTSSLFTADAVMVTSIAPSMGTLVESGHDAITQYLTGQFAEGARLTSFTENEVSQVRHNVVMLVGQWHGTGNSKGGHYDLIGHWTGVAVRFGHGWRIRLLTAFTDPPTGAG